MKPPRELDLPFDDWRPGQQLAIRTALHSKKRDVVIQSPTGSGKSTIAAALVKLEPGRTAILTASRALQDQYSSTFEFLYDIRGMGNYECLLPKDDLIQIRRGTSKARMCDDGPCRSGYKCDLKEDGCLYFDRYRGALASGAVLPNYAYWLAMRRFSKGLGPVSRLIMDEAHALPEELMSAYRIEIALSHLPKHANTFKTWKQWVVWASAYSEELKPRGDLPEDNRQRRQRVIEQLQMLTKIDDTWAWDVYDSKMVFEPTVPRLLLPLLCDDAVAPKRVYLSATITPSTLKLLDIAPADVEFKVMKSRFPVQRRPVYLVESTRVDHKMSREQVAWWLSRMDKIISSRLDRRGIIHTVSYQRMYDILKGSKYAKIMLAPHRASEIGSVLARFTRTPPPVILISPSISTGFNFPYTLAEYQIISKVPFPDTRSSIARARIAATEGYRDHLTAQSLVQAAGRICRAEDDQGECVAPETLVLSANLRWVEAGSLSIGDRLLGVDEAGNGRGHGRRYRWADVVKAQTRSMPRARVFLDDGTDVVCTPNHPWIVQGRGPGRQRCHLWKRTDHLKRGDRLVRVLHPWHGATTYMEGWLAGFFDGEGCLVFRSGRRNPNVAQLSASQNEGAILNQAQAFALAAGFENSIVRQRDKVRHLKILGGFGKILEFLGRIRPTRLLLKFWQSERAEKVIAASYPCVVDVQRLENGPITSLQTTAQTYIAAGLIAHNTFILDDHARWFIPRARNLDLLPEWFTESLVWVGGKGYQGRDIPAPPSALKVTQ